MRKFFIICTLLLTSLANAQLPQRPKLIVMIVMDQFRADYLMRFRSRFLPEKQGTAVGGYAYLVNQGAYFPYGEYSLLQSMTGPGHATVLTGAYGYQSGIPSNDWYSQDAKDWVYCVEDKDSPTVGAKIVNPHVGTSPKNLFASTVGDELKNAGYPSRVVTVALKDRAAILMGGHRADIAVWLDQGSLQWVSSKYYLPNGKLPDWMRNLNQEMNTMKGRELTWTAEGKGTGYSAENAMPLLNESNAGKMGGPGFPHHAIAGSKGSYAMPFGLEINELAAERAITAYNLGHGQATDLFALSFSSHDYTGHAFGPNSREQEEMTVAEDKLISKFLNFLNAKVGLQNVDLVFTGDHGIPMNPDYAQSLRFPAGRIDENALGEKISSHLAEHFGKLSGGQKYVVYLHDFNFHLNKPAIADVKLDLAQVEAEAKKVILEEPGTAFVLTGAEYALRQFPPGMLEKQAIHTYFPGRSGDLILIPRPGFVLDKDDTVSHLTGYSYDRTVPLIFVGSAFKSGTYATRAEIVDIAPTLSFVSGIIPPNLSEGRVLSEILNMK